MRPIRIASLLSPVLLLAAFDTAAVPDVELQVTAGPAAQYCTVPGMPNDCTVPPTALGSVGPGEDVVTAYTITNTGTVALTRHDLVDSVAGTVLTDFPFTLTPGADAFLTQRSTAPLEPGFYSRSATWTARNTLTPVSSASDADPYVVRVLQPRFTLSATVAPAASVCSNTNDLGTCTVPTTTSIQWSPGIKVVIGYRVTNTGAVTFRRHTLVDPALGTLLTDFPFTLEAGANAFLLQFDTPATDVVRTAVWTAETVTGYATSDPATYRVSRVLFDDGFE